MPRPDLYRPIHKAIRALLFETTGLCARTDFADVRGARQAAQALRRLCAFLHEHAQHEDAVIGPELLRLAPDLAADLRNDHARLGGLEAELVDLAGRLDGERSSERFSLGLRVQDRLGRLVAEHLGHLEREECQANRILWAHLGDGELGALEERILASIEPGRLGQWLEVLLPALSSPECAQVLGRLQGAVPPGAFADLTRAARAALGEERWSAALGAIPSAGSRAGGAVR